MLAQDDIDREVNYILRGLHDEIDKLQNQIDKLRTQYNSILDSFEHWRSAVLFQLSQARMTVDKGDK